MNQIEINETIKAANLYLTRLKFLNNEIDFALKQIQTTYEETEIHIKETFIRLRETLVEILYKREKSLLEKAKKTKIDCLAPLRECRAMILAKMEATMRLISKGATIINDGQREVALFCKNASLLGSLPEVPELKDVPYLTFYYEPSQEIEIIEKFENFGDIYKMSPVHIDDIIERPGAILVEWKCGTDNDDKISEIEEFRLQKVVGDVTKDTQLIRNFEDCYKGMETQYLIKHVQEHQPYSFRVCCRFEGKTEWSHWSLPQVGCTTIKHYSWKFNLGYSYTNEYRVATPNGHDAEMLYSDSPQFGVGHSLDFMFLEADSSDAVVGLVSTHIEKLPKTSKEANRGTFLMTNKGKILVDGEERATVLPEFRRGSKVTFTCTTVNEEKIRVSIDSGDKRVTYDWLVNPMAKMHFVAQFCSSNWIVIVE